MRREIYRMERAAAIALFERAPVVRLASTTADGEPVLRTVHGVVVDGALCFHGAPAGEKAETIGRPAVAGADEIVAEIPSYFVDPERACPATTYYLSAQVHGRLEAVEDPAQKARVLMALMERFQPEGGHAPITPEHPLYRAAVRGLLVARIPLEHVEGKQKLGQNRTPEELGLVLSRMWRRGREGDARAIELVRQANPETPTPPFLRGPEGLAVRLRCALGPGDAEAAATLLATTYWNLDTPRAAIVAAQQGSPAWVGAHDEEGALVGCARAISDGSKHALLLDVMVAPSLRGRGLGQALVRLLLDHPAVRGCRILRLRTRDAMGLYEKFGFAVAAGAPSHVEMQLLR